MKIDRSALTDVGVDKPLDYADPRLWLCRPGNDPDECDANLDATELLPDGTQQLVKHVKAQNPANDCFYVYPTVKLTSAGPAVASISACKTCAMRSSTTSST